MKRIIRALMLAVLAGSGMMADFLLERAKTADAIVVGEVGPVTGSADAVQFSVSVRRVLRGPSLEGSITVTFTRKHDSRLPPFQGNGGCRILFLQSQGRDWRAIPLSRPLLGIEELSFPTDQCAHPERAATLVQAPLDDGQLFEEIVRGVESSPEVDPAYVHRLFNGFSPKSFRKVVDAGDRLSRSSNPALRLLGLAWRIAAGDPNAAVEIAAEFDLINAFPSSGTLAQALASYSNTNRLGVKAIGEIAIRDQGWIARAASEALRSIHSTDTLPYLYIMLDSPVERMRENAIAGFSMFLLGIPTLNDDNKSAAFERGINPATRKPLTADEEPHIHFGALKDKNQESELIRWWKTWWLAKQSGR
jgi:hypothetical protein